MGGKEARERESRDRVQSLATEKRRAVAVRTVSRKQASHTHRGTERKEGGKSLKITFADLCRFFLRCR